MEPSQQTQDQTLGLTKCPHCRAEIPSHNKFCTSCSYPINGTDDELRTFRIDMARRRSQLKEAENKTEKAAVILYILAGLCFLMGLIAWAVSDDYMTLVINSIISILYLVFAAWSNRNPFAAMLTALIVYLTTVILNAAIDPSTLFSGILFKIIIIGTFVKGIQSASEAKAYMEELNKFRRTSDDNG